MHFLRLWWGSFAIWWAIMNGMVGPMTSLLLIEALAYVVLRRYVMAEQARGAVSNNPPKMLLRNIKQNASF
jgi:hypothetical protein